MFIFFMISIAGPRMSILWPLTLGTGDRSIMVMDGLMRVLESQCARQVPAMPAPDIRILSSGKAMFEKHNLMQNKMSWAGRKYIVLAVVLR
jgi:hypothetical protein